MTSHSELKERMSKRIVELCQEYNLDLKKKQDRDTLEVLLLDEFSDEEEDEDWDDDEEDEDWDDDDDDEDDDEDEDSENETQPQVTEKVETQEQTLSQLLAEEEKKKKKRMIYWGVGSIAAVALFFLSIELFTFASIIVFLYGYYRACKWLTYNFFRETPEKVGNWVDDTLLVYARKTLGVILMLPFSIIIIIIGIALIAALAGGGGGGSSSNYSRGSSRDDDDEDRNLVYQAQVRGGTTWLNISGARNEDGAISSVVYEKSRNPDKQYRVVAKTKYGKILHTVYSC